LEHLERASKIAENFHNSEFQVACFVQLALTHLALGELEKVSKALQDSDRLLLDGDLPVLTRARRIACRFQLALAKGDLEAARFWLQATPGEHDAHPFNRFLDLNTARLFMAERKFDFARSELNKAAKLAEESGWGYASLIVLVLQALTAESEKNALEKLAKALVQAEPEGYTRLFLDQGEALKPLLKTAAHQGITPLFVEKLLSVDKGIQAAFPKPGPEYIEPISGRELEVLRLVAEGMSNREIASELIISTGTAKSHIHHLCGKLGVRNRTEAAMKAKALGLF
jgi:LuxR family maltose regulon positive regulatory protein